MKNINLRVLLSALCMASILAGFTKVGAAPIRFDQVIQIVNAQPGKSESGAFSRLRVAGDYSFLLVGDDDDDKKKKDAQRQDGRVITETKTDVVNDDTCDCPGDIEHRHFPKWALLGLVAIPIAIILINRHKDTPTPTPSIPMTPTTTPTPGTPTPTPPDTPTPTPTPGTPTPTPPMTPTPTPPQPVPEPVTILLFGTGLAGIGMAARRRFGKKDKGAGKA